MDTRAHQSPSTGGVPSGTQAIAASLGADALALRTALTLWAEGTTDVSSHCRRDLLRAKMFAAASFFAHAGKHPAQVKAADVREWRAELERQELKPATVYARISRLSSFYEWALRDAALSQIIHSNPARLARPKSPRAYQTESSKALDDEQVSALVRVVAKKAQENLVGKRDYALLLFFVTTGMRRHEVISLRGSDIELKSDYLVVRSRVKGGDYVGREVSDPTVRTALVDYLTACERANVLGSERSVWTRHDSAGKPGAPLTSHAFAKNLKAYARAAGLDHIHIHQTRHTFARMVAEETGSLIETQDALGHRNLATTRVYVQRIAVKRDKHGRQITARLGIAQNMDEKP